MSQPVKRANTGKGPARIAPIYKRLPHGPHQLARNEVIQNQRARIYGAMVEAVARSGYERTSVKQVIGLAGVSRRSFYEQFSNKEECFLATFDVIAGRDIKRLRKAYAAAEGDLEDRLRAAFCELAASARENRNRSMLAFVAAQTAGAGGALRLRRATTTCEQMLARTFAESRGACVLPAPIVRGITGGLHGAMSTVLYEDQAAQRPELAEDMLRWTLLFQTPAAAQMDERLALRLARRMRQISLASAHQPSGEAAAVGDDRQRLLHNALRLAALHEYSDLTAPQIADEAQVPIDDFLALYTSKDECFLAALDMLAGDVLEIVASPDLVSDDWPRAVRRVLGQLMDYLSERPLYSRTIAQEAFLAGSHAMRQNLDLANDIATLLTEGAPTAPRSGIATEGIAGAFLHTIRCQVAGGRIQLLPVLADYLSYIVLAPFIGAKEAFAIVTEDADS
ncbi:MAG: TetR/AcrR family transcriptional regulator [Solirubrobacteraceae bacterium]